jgi:hypothetical protein
MLSPSGRNWQPIYPSLRKQHVKLKTIVEQAQDPKIVVPAWIYFTPGTLDHS